MNESRLDGTIRTSLENLKKIVDVNTVVGEPIVSAGGVTVIPVSKVSLGFVSGGADFAGKKAENTERPGSFAGGGGSGVTILPVGFLVIKADGNVEFLAAESKSQSGAVGSVVDLIEKSPDIVEKFKRLFAKKGDKADKESKKEDAAEPEKEAEKESGESEASPT